MPRADRGAGAGTESREVPGGPEGSFFSWDPADPTATGDQSPAPGPGHGRVDVLMTKDGDPFRGGHVCFFPAAVFVEPAPWDGRSGSDGAYQGVPLPTSIWPHYDPVLGSGAPVPLFQPERGVTGADGRVSVAVAAARELVVFVRHSSSGIALRANPRINVAEGGEVSLTIEAAPVRTLRGRCIDGGGAPLAGMLVQALSPHAERPISRTTSSSADGEFELAVIGDDAAVRVRAVAPYWATPLGIYESAEAVEAVPQETTVSSVVPGSGSVEVRMPAAPLVFLELLGPDASKPLTHVQIEGLVYDTEAGAWQRLGGPQYRRASAGPASPEGGDATGRAVIGIPRDVASRPLMVWSWGATLTSVDLRGVDRAHVTLTRGRRVSVRGSGWDPGDRLRVVTHCGVPESELPCVWIEGEVSLSDSWSRTDAPPCDIDFALVRKGVVVARSARIPASKDAANEVVLDAR